jgi:hypothetical protein
VAAPNGVTVWLGKDALLGLVHVVAEAHVGAVAVVEAQMTVEVGSWFVIVAVSELLETVPVAGEIDGASAWPGKLKVTVVGADCAKAVLLPGHPTTVQLSPAAIVRAALLNGTPGDTVKD